MQNAIRITKQVSVQGWRWWTGIARQPVFATIANVLGVFAGLLGALYTDDIRRAFPFALGPYSGISIHAIIFWSAFSVFALTFLSREWSIDKQREAAQEQLEETIRTMPPRDFVVEFAKFYSQSHKAVQALDAATAATEAEVQAAIRVILYSIAQLARRFDAAQQYTYSANIMLYWPSVDKWQKHANTQSMPDIKFVELEAAVDRIPLLVLENLLSASTDHSQPGDPDPAMGLVANLALPIPAAGRSGRSEDGKRWRVLPGAPLTFFTQKPNSYGNAGELGKWCRDRGDFSESVSAQIDQYFGQDTVRNVIASFASIPIKSSLGGNPIGVVNLHSDGLEMLTSAGAPSQFFPLTEPFTSLLADALRKLLKFDDKG